MRIVHAFKNIQQTTPATIARMDDAKFALAIEHLEHSSPAAFNLRRLSDGKSVEPVNLVSPYEFPVKNQPNSNLIHELRWYLERFLSYPFHPETIRAEHVLDALRSWGAQAFDLLFDRREAGAWLASSAILQVRSDDPYILSWPWEALFDSQTGSFVAHERRIERRLNKVPDPPPLLKLPRDGVNILLVVARPYQTDVRYRSIARPLLELIHTRRLPAHVDVLRPPTFNQLRDHLRARPAHYHVLHFDGHGTYNSNGQTHSSHQFRASEGALVFESENGGPEPKSARDLSVLLRDYAVPLVVLNACQSASLDEKADDALATVATALLQSGMRSVVAMAYSLYVSGGQAFLPSFYRSLFETGSVADAVRAGRQQMLSNKLRISARGPFPLEDWLLPVLYQQDPLNFNFAAEAKPNILHSRLPKEIVEHQDAFGFVGRDGPILEMERALHRKAPAILVHGLGGVGKTTLVRGFLRWMDETGGLQGALWFDFRDIRTAEYVLNRTGESFYGTDFGSAPNKLDLLCQALKRDRVVMIWDNFEYAKQNLTQDDQTLLVRLLDTVRGTPSKVILTSRSPEEWLAPELRFAVGLAGLDGEERWEYCEAIVRELGLKINREDRDLINLIEQLGGHPLAMRVVLPKLEHMSAAQVGKALRNNIQELACSEHEDQRRLFATVRFVEQGVPKELQTLLSLIGLHEKFLSTGLFEIMAEQIDPGFAVERIIELMAVLAKAGLVQRINTDVYEMHPLLTGYLRSQHVAGEDFQRAFVKAMTVASHTLQERPNHEIRIPLTLLESNLYIAMHLAKEIDVYDEFMLLNKLLSRQKLEFREFSQASRLYKDLAQYATSRNDATSEALAYHQLGVIAHKQMDLANARRWYAKSLTVKDQDFTTAPMTYHQLGMLEEDNRDLTAAREWYMKSLEFQPEQNHSRLAAKSFNELGRLAQREREFVKAREYYQKSLAISETEHSWDIMASTYHQLGRLAEDQHDAATAREWYLKSVAIKEELGDFNSAASSYHGLGIVAQMQSDVDAASDWFMKSLAIKEKIKDLDGAAATYHQLGMLAANRGDFETARGWYLKALDTTEKFSDAGRAAITYHQLGRLAERQGNFEEAQERYLRSAEINSENNEVQSLAKNFAQLGRISMLQGRMEESGRWLIRSISSFLRAKDQNSAKLVFQSYLPLYHLVTKEQQQRLITAWRDAGLEHFHQELKGGDGENSSRC